MIIKMHIRILRSSCKVVEHVAKFKPNLILLTDFGKDFANIKCLSKAEY
jgi:hypothetical protein